MKKPTGSALSTRLFALLPQTQCKRCGYDDCAGYADAMASGAADLNQCAPGGSEGIVRLSQALHRSPKPLNPAHGVEGPRAVAFIDEEWCIGCTKCLDACPTDAILGAAKRMHTVVAIHCTGCELCIPACPVDCIATVNETGSRTGWAAWSREQAARSLKRYRLREARLHREETNDEPSEGSGCPSDDPMLIGDPEASLLEPAAPASAAPATPSDRKRAIIEAALQRARSAPVHRSPTG